MSIAPSARFEGVLAAGVKRRAAFIGAAPIEVRDSPLGGKGLFATSTMPPGAIVAEMTDPARMRKKAWEVYRVAVGLPHDACIHVERSPLVFYDAAWDSQAAVPLWYRQNHAREGIANVKMTLADRTAGPHDQRLLWRTTRIVEEGEELRFTYTDVPREWDRE